MTPSELEQLRAENAELRRTVAELQEFLDEVTANQAEPSWAERQKEYDALLEEKSEVIRGLHQKLQELQDRPAAATPKEEELLALNDSLEHERRQLQEDEEVVRRQMRELEVQMSRERAELARQRHDIQRLREDLERELESATRDAAVRERLLPLQRRFQELSNRKNPPSATPTPALGATQDTLPPASPPEPEPRKDSGLLRRLFGQGKR